MIKVLVDVLRRLWNVFAGQNACQSCSGEHLSAMLKDRAGEIKFGCCQ